MSDNLKEMVGMVIGVFGAYVIIVGVMISVFIAFMYFLGLPMLRYAYQFVTG